MAAISQETPGSQLTLHAEKINVNQKGQCPRTLAGGREAPVHISEPSAHRWWGFLTVCWNMASGGQLSRESGRCGQTRCASQAKRHQRLRMCCLEWRQMNPSFDQPVDKAATCTHGP